GLSIAFKEARPKTFFTDRFVVVTSIAGPAGHKFERRLPSIGHAVSYVSRNIMKASRGHPFRPGPPGSVHHDEHPSSFDATVVLSAIALHVEMTVRHEIFVPDSSRLDQCCAPKQTAFSSLGNRRVPMDSVNDGIQIQPFSIVPTLKEPLQLPKGFCGLVHLRSDKVTARPFYMGNFAKV